MQNREEKKIQEEKYEENSRKKEQKKKFFIGVGKWKLCSNSQRSINVKKQVIFLRNYHKHKHVQVHTYTYRNILLKFVIFIGIEWSLLQRDPL